MIEQNDPMSRLRAEVARLHDRLDAVIDALHQQPPPAEAKRLWAEYEAIREKISALDEQMKPRDIK
jgi:hypothetical protein